MANLDQVPETGAPDRCGLAQTRRTDSGFPFGRLRSSLRNSVLAGGGPRGFPFHRALYHPEKLFSFGDDFWIEDDSGRQVYLVDGRAFLFREKLVPKDADGNRAGLPCGKLVSLGRPMKSTAAGTIMATVSKHLFNFLRCRFTVDVSGPDDYEAQGSFLDPTTGSPQGTGPWRPFQKWLTVQDTMPYTSPTGTRC